MGQDICARNVLSILTCCHNGVAMKNVVRIKHCFMHLETDQHSIVVVGGSFLLSP